MGSVSSNYPVASAKSRVADVFRDKFPSNASDDLRAALRAAYAAGGRSAVATLLAGRTTPLKRRQVIAAISRAEERALAYRPSMRTVGKRASRFALRNGSVPKFTARDLASIKRTISDLESSGDGSEPHVMTSIGYVDVWAPDDRDDGSVTVNGVNYTLDELERASKRKTLKGRVTRRKVKRPAAKNGRKPVKRDRKSTPKRRARKAR